MENDCLFCKMVKGTIPVNRVYEDSSYICIKDINPQAKIHLLVIPKTHVASVAAAFPESGDSGQNVELMGGLFQAAAKIARQQGLLPGGFRSVLNTEKNACQTIFHLHLHLLGGEPLGSRMG